MFLRSEAFRDLGHEQVRRWDWSRTTVLWISFDWDPVEGGAEALAGRRLATRLLDAGARLHVVAGEGSHECLRGPNYGLTVVPKQPFPDNKLLRAWQMVRSGIPESQCAWVPVAVDAGRRALASLPQDTIIYSRAMPGSSNIVGWRLAQASGLPWVAHFSDEWPPVQALANGRRWLAPYKAPLFELWRRRVVRDAGAMTFTNPHQGDVVLGRDGHRYASKAFVVTHLPTPATAARAPQQHERFHIVHTGNISPRAGHTAQTLLRGLAMFFERTPAARSQVRFTQAGWHAGDIPDWTHRCGLADVVHVMGRQTPAGVAALLASANLLVGVDYARPNSATLLSKLPDYINAGRPILVVTHRSSAMGRLFNDDGAGLTASFDAPSQVADRIAAVFGAWQQRLPDAFLPTRTAIESFAPDRVLSELAGAFTVARRTKRAPDAQPRTGVTLVRGEVAP